MPAPQDLAQSRASSFTPAEHTFAPAEYTFAPAEHKGGPVPRLSWDIRCAEARPVDICSTDIRPDEARPGELRGAEVHVVESSLVALVVDDDRRVARLLTALLAPDFSVLCVKTVKEALCWLRAIPRVDVAFVADVLPDGFGPNLFPWLRDRYPHAPRVLMSTGDGGRFGHADVEWAHVLLTKPLNPRWVRCIGSSAGVLRK